MSLNKKGSILLSFAFLPMALSCAPSYVHLKDYVYAYGTTFELHLYQGTEEDLKDIASYIKETSRVLDLNDDTLENGLYALNHEGEVLPHQFLLEAYQEAESVRVKLPQAFSYALGELTSSWLEALEEGHLLDEDRILDLKEKAAKTTVVFQENKLVKSGEGQIDFGAIGKGLCLKNVQKTLQKRGISDYLINGGTSSILIGNNPGNKKGTTRVDLVDAPKRYFNAKNISLSVSSSSRQRYEINGVTYSHIVSPLTGVPTSPIDGVLVVGDDPARADALSTALFVLGATSAVDLSLLEGMDIALMKDGEVIYESRSFLL